MRWLAGPILAAAACSHGGATGAVDLGPPDLSGPCSVPSDGILALSTVGTQLLRLSPDGSGTSDGPIASMIDGGNRPFPFVGLAPGADANSFYLMASSGYIFPLHASAIEPSGLLTVSGTALTGAAGLGPSLGPGGANRLLVMTADTIYCLDTKADKVYRLAQVALSDGCEASDVTGSCSAIALGAFDVTFTAKCNVGSRVFTAQGSGGAVSSLTMTDLLPQSNGQLVGIGDDRVITDAGRMYRPDLTFIRTTRDCLGPMDPGNGMPLPVGDL